MNEPLDDEDLVARYRTLPRPEPSAALDATVLAQARAAVRRTRPAWMAPLAAAAVVVLAVAVGWQLRGVPFESPVVLPQADSSLPAERAGGAPVDAAANADATPVTAAAERNEAPAGAGPGARAPAPLREAKAERERQAEQRSAVSLEAPSAPAPGATAPPPEAPVQALSKAQQAETTPPPAAPPAPPLVAAAPVAPMAAEAASAELVRDAATDLADLEPAEWMDAIRRLREAGDVDAARAELGRLLDRHPDLELPADLRDLRE